VNNIQVLTIVMALASPFLAVLTGLLVNNARPNDLRDSLNQRIDADQSELPAKLAETVSRLSRPESERRIVL